MVRPRYKVGDKVRIVWTLVRDFAKGKIIGVRPAKGRYPTIYTIKKTGGRRTMRATASMIRKEVE